jgi:hypothetical protein
MPCSLPAGRQVPINYKPTSIKNIPYKLTPFQLIDFKRKIW